MSEGPCWLLSSRAQKDLVSQEQPAECLSPRCRKRKLEAADAELMVKRKPWVPGDNFVGDYVAAGSSDGSQTLTTKVQVRRLRAERPLHEIEGKL